MQAHSKELKTGFTFLRYLHRTAFPSGGRLTAGPVGCWVQFVQETESEEKPGGDIRTCSLSGGSQISTSSLSESILLEEPKQQEQVLGTL